MQKDAFFAMAVGPARASQTATGVPASVTLAQAIIESGWGDSHMGDAWNFFGIKAHGDEPCVVVRTREVVDGKDVYINAKFCRFASMQECFRAHGEFLRDNPRYAPAFRTKDAESFARAIHAAGYATDPHYGEVLVGIIRENNLTQYDTGTTPALLEVDPKAPRVYRLQRQPLRGPVVTAIQQALARAGSDPGPIDGVFGKGTDAAVRRYQKAHGLAVDGVVGPATAGRLGVTLRPARTDARTMALHEQAVTPPALELCYPHPIGARSSICQGLHPTAGLDGNWGVDFCAPGGTPVFAVEKGVIVKLSGHAPTEVIDPTLGIFGWNIHYATPAGYRYFSTHYGTKKCAVGQQVIPGTLLGEVGQWPGDPGRSHTHLGVTSPKSVDDAKAHILAVSKAPRLPIT